jgi:tetratricopeptide (TPR) repeat protein
MKLKKSIKPFFNVGIVLLFLSVTLTITAQHATIREGLTEFKTYPFSDPDPVPKINRMYPYFYFHGYTNKAIQQKWKMVVLENEYIEVYVCPDIGGKIWGAIEKSTEKEFLYFNHVVKFRDVAMRGAWTSGGLEYNFGDIGHSPTCATPVDYITKENADGSVSCVVGAIDLPSGTKWNVEIKVSPGKAFFETKASWFNNTELTCTYYHWMNAAAKAGDDLEFIYPGKNWIGHGEETGNWPQDKDRNINWYKNNNFGSYKSYHVINSYSNYFGGYYHNENFGFGHLSDFDEKPGKKIWIWGLADEGMIWEDLLTDTDGQYIEFQAGKLFNQAANSSTNTPFKHKEFAPHDADVMNEIWFPLKETKGMVAASEYGVLNLVTKNNSQTILLSALQAIDDELQVFINGNLHFSERLKLKPLELFETAVEVGNADVVKIVLGENKLTYSSNKKDILIDRPLKPNEDFNWESAYGLYTKGLELEKQREYIGAKKAYQKALEKDAGFLPALNRMALSFFRQMNYKKALEYVNKSLAINTYDGEANYLLGLICREIDEIATSKSGFSIAMGQVAFRTAAATELAIVFLKEKDWEKAGQYAQKALAYNTFNIEALQVLAITKRKLGEQKAATKALERIAELDGTNHFQKIENFLLFGKNADKEKFMAGITNELPHESYLDLAINYYKKGCTEEAVKVLEMAPENPITGLWIAFLDEENRDKYMEKALSLSAEFVFPHRIETAKVLNELMKEKPHWKLNYYLGLILWNKGLAEEAGIQFASCGTKPDFAAFYLAKMKLANEKAKRFECVVKACELEPDDWRAALAMAEYYLSENSGVEAMEILRPFLKTNPEQPAIGLLYAQCLSAQQEYDKAIRFLESYEILPFEGATIGRDLYNETCVRSAFSALKKGKNNEAIKLAEKAKKWPVNLGVGRPYDVDERLEDYILFLAFKAKGDETQARKFASKIMEYRHPAFKEENSRLYLQLTVMQQNGKKQQADNLLNRFLQEYPESKYMKWVEAKYRKTLKAGEIEQELLRRERAFMAYDTKFVDKGFPLLLDFLKGFE